MGDKCRLCSRPAIENLDPATRLCLVCGRHRTMVLEALREARSVDRHSRLLGFGLPVDQGTTEDAPLRCDRSMTNYEAHTWTGNAGDSCPFCLAMYVDALAEERSRLLDSIDLDPNDERYPDEVLRRGKRLANAVSMGLVTPDEARTTFDRWASHV